MRKFKNKAKSALAVLLSAAMTFGAVPVSWAAEEAEIEVVEDTETITGGDTAEIPEISQGEAAAAPEISQDDLSIEEIILEEDGSAGDASEENPEIPDAESMAESAGSEESAVEEDPEALAAENLSGTEGTESGEVPEISEAEAAVEEPEIEVLDAEETADPSEEEENPCWMDIWDDNDHVHELLPGEDLRLTIQVWQEGVEGPLDPGDYELTWESSNEEIASVQPDEDEEGLDPGQQRAVVTAVGELDPEIEDASSVITATAKVGEFTVEREWDVFVRNGFWVLMPMDDWFDLYPGQSQTLDSPSLIWKEAGKEEVVREDAEFEWIEPKGGELLSLDYGSENDVSVTLEYFDDTEDIGDRNHVELRATIPGDETFELINRFDFNPRYKWIGLNDNFDNRGNHFPGEEVQISLDQDGIDESLKDNLSVEWNVSEWDESADDWAPTTKASIEKISDYEAKLVCQEEGNIRVSADLIYNGRDAGCGEIFYNIISETEEYSFNEFEDTLRSMPDRDYWISTGTVHYYRQNPKYPDGDEGDLPITDVEVNVIDGREDCITCDPEPIQDSEEKNYHIRVNSMGTAEVTITYQTPDNKSAKHTCLIVCDGEQYNTSMFFEPDNSGHISPGEEVKLKLELWHEYLDENGNYQNEWNPKSAKVEWICRNDWGKELRIVPDEEDPYVCTVKAPADNECGGAAIQVKISVNGELVGEDERYVSVNDFTIDTGLGQTSIVLPEGKGFTVTPSLFQFNPETGEKEKITGVRYLVRDYDMDVAEVTGEGGNPSEDGVFESAEDGSFTIRRKEGKTDGTNINIFAQIWNDEWQDWEEVANTNLYLDWLDYHVWFDIPDGGYRMFTEGQDTLEVRANTENLRCDSETGLTGPLADPEYEVGVWIGEDDFAKMAENSEYTVEKDEYGIPSTVILNCEAVKNWMVENNYWERDEDGNVDPWSFPNLEVKCLVNGEEDSAGVEVRVPYIEFEDGDGREFSPGGGTFYTKGIANCYVENASYPMGEVLPFTITDVRFVKLDDDGNPTDEDDTSGIAVKETESDGTIRITARKDGGVGVWFSTENDEYGEQEFLFKVFVNSERYVLELSGNTWTNQVLPGKNFTIKPEVYRITYLGDDKPEDERYEEVELSPDQYRVEFNKTDDDERIKVNQQTGEVTVLDEYEEDESCGYRVEVSVFRSENDKENFIAGDDFYFDVVPCYYTVEAKDTLFVGPGGTADLQDMDLKLMRFDRNHRDGIDESGDKVKFKLTSDNPEELTVNEEGTVLTVSPAAQPGQVFYYYIEALKDKYGNSIWTETHKQVTVCGHNFEETARTEATCTHPGSVTLKCSQCGEEKTEEIPLKAHTPGEWQTTKAATCTAKGEQVQKCAVCNDSLGTREINATGHTPGEWQVTTAATCTKEGVQTQKCTVCGTVLDTKPTTAKAAHTPGDWETTKAATCTTAGERTQKCKVCGAVLKTESIAAAGHTFGEWKVTSKPTALREGTETRTCSACNETETRSVAKLRSFIKLNVKKLPLQVKESTTAVKVVSMAEGDAIASWKSSKPKIASVNKKGRITGKKKGTSVITVTLKSGKKASVTVVVQKEEVKTTKIAVTAASAVIKNKKMTMKKGKKDTLKVTLTPLTSTDKVTFTSSDKKIVTVNNKGKLTAKKAGKAKITVKAGDKKMVITVTVKK